MTQRLALLSAACLAVFPGGAPGLSAQEALKGPGETGPAETGPAEKGPGGETICAPRARLLARLEHGRDFAAQGQGLRDSEAMIEIRADVDGNWLLLQNYADGLSCLLAMGEAWDGAGPTAPRAGGVGRALPPDAVPPAKKTDPA
ncbi:hypothetical protein [Paracoccus sp. IB05]|uniref:hypothetical protein n=1 Tax=Paracoccus sp. IB05 TaxID=2779367 RepID=UPI0018E6E207|nr:hypothetical protein [Paracoccus sp. IB05]MBJ2151504.1 hypothetical protein [Paracoccus sp. IB05]